MLVQNFREVDPTILLEQVRAVDENSPASEFKNLTSKFDLTFFILEEEDRKVRAVIVHLCQALLPPNITFNRNETELRRQNVVDEVKQVFFQVMKGEMIVRGGQRLGKEQVLKLQMQFGLICQFRHSEQNSKNLNIGRKSEEV